MVLISHDHYDHLDGETIRPLRGKTGRFIVPLCVGAHVKAVGSYEPHVQETDPALLDLIFVDSKKALLKMRGDFIQPLSEGRFNPDTIAGELGFLHDGKLTGRTSDDQITFFKTVGIAVQDVLAAREVYRRTVETDTGMDVNL